MAIVRVHLLVIIHKWSQLIANLHRKMDHSNKALLLRIDPLKLDNKHKLIINNLLIEITKCSQALILVQILKMANKELIKLLMDKIILIAIEPQQLPQHLHKWHLHLEASRLVDSRVTILILLLPHQALKLLIVTPIPPELKQKNDTYIYIYTFTYI